MEQDELIERIMTMIKAMMCTAKTEAENGAEPLQLSKEPKRLKLDKTKADA